MPRRYLGRTLEGRGRVPAESDNLGISSNSLPETVALLNNYSALIQTLSHPEVSV